MVSLARTATGLLYQGDGSLTGWTNGGSWSSASDPAFCCFGPLPVAVLAPAGGGAGSEADGVREPQPYDESGVRRLLYDAGDGRAGWREYLAATADRGRTWTRTGATPEGYAAVGGGTVGAYANGWLEKRGSTYWRHRTLGGAGATPNIGLPSSPYTWDTWSASSLDGPWTGVRTVGPDVGSWMDGDVQPGTTWFDGSTYHQFPSGKPSGSGTVGRVTASSPGGPWTRQDPAILTTSTTGLGSRNAENARVFFHPALSVYVLLANAYLTDHTDRNVQAVSASLTDWSAATIRQHQKVCPLDTGQGAVGTSCHVTGPDGALIYDVASGIVPVVYDADPRRFATGWHLGRSIRAAALEPSASCLRYAGSGDTTARSLSRTLSHTNIVVEMICEPTAFNGGGGSLTVEYRSDGSGNAYRARLASDGVWSLFKVASGSESTLATGSGSMTFDASHFLHRIKVAVSGNAHTLTLDGEVQVAFTDSSSPIASGTTFALTGKGLACDVRCLSCRTSDVVTVAGLTPGTGCYVRGYGAFPAGSVVAGTDGTGTFTHPHSPLWAIELGGTDYAPSGGIWGGDTLTFSGLPSSGSPVAISPRAFR